MALSEYAAYTLDLRSWRRTNNAPDEIFATTATHNNDQPGTTPSDGGVRQDYLGNLE
jgi:hypothetical protein